MEDTYRKGSAIEIYKKTGDFNTTLQQTGLSAVKLQIILAKAGLLSIQDKIHYGTKTVRLGGEAEALFSTLVPEAINCNEMRHNNPCYDFLYKGLKIDVKFSSLHRPDYFRNYTPSYRIGVGNKDKDMVVAFFERDYNQELKDPYIAVISRAMMRRKYLTFTVGIDSFKQIIVPKEDLIALLDEYAALKELHERV